MELQTNQINILARKIREKNYPQEFVRLEYNGKKCYGLVRYACDYCQVHGIATCQTRAPKPDCWHCFTCDGHCEFNILQV